MCECEWGSMRLRRKAKWQSGKGGSAECSDAVIKKLYPPFAFKGFGKPHNADLHPSEFSKAACWAVIWASAQLRPISPIFRCNLVLHTEYSPTSSQYHQGLVISIVQSLLWFFLHDLSNRHFLIYPRFSLVARGLPHHYDLISHHTGDCCF